PIAIPYVHRRIESKYRATYDSIQSMLNSASVAIVYLICSALLNGEPQSAATISHLWAIMGASLVAVTFFLFLIRPRNS
ncbi:hypothetical protein KKG46_03870, partial [Patescibacteria group bacterium]|nr:hypothetical protein [Patescibacteria group bacterium]